MSDSGRKGVGEQFKEKATPQDQKVYLDSNFCRENNLTSQSYTQQVSETLCRVKAAVVPDEKKSTTQSASDSLRGGLEKASSEGKGAVRQAKDATNNLVGGNQASSSRST